MDVENLIREERNVIPRPFVLKYFPLVPSRGRGCKLYDEAGKEYIDLTSGAATYIVGFNHPDVVREVVEQVENLFNYTTLYFYNRPSIELARKLADLAPGHFPKKVVFGFSGSDAMEIALTASLNYARRGKLVSFTESFHGTLVLSASVSGIIRDVLGGRGGPWYKDVVFVEYPNPYRNKWGVDGYEKPGELTSLALKELEEALKAAGDVAAIVIEPVQGDAGVVVPPKDFVKEVAGLAGEHGSLLVVDEAQTGLGRTGAWWGIEHYGVAADVLVSAKALGGGFPLSAVVARSDVLEALPRAGLGFTNMGHAVSCRAGLATIRVIEREGLVERARVLGDYLARRLREVQEKHPVIGDVRGLGLMVGVEVVEDQRSRRPSRAKALKVAWSAWRRGVITTPLGRHGNVLRLTPPLNIPLEDLEKAVTVLEDAVKDVEEGRVPDEAVEGVEGWGSWS